MKNEVVKEGDDCTMDGATVAKYQYLVMTAGSDPVLTCVAQKCMDDYYLVHNAAGRLQGWCHACAGVPGAEARCQGDGGKLGCPDGYDVQISKNGGDGDQCVKKNSSGESAAKKPAEEKNKVPDKNPTPRQKGPDTDAASAQQAQKQDRAREQEREKEQERARMRGLQAEVDSIAGQINDMRRNVSTNRSVWKNREGNFNTSRLASDSIAGAVLGTVGGVVTYKIVKKNQIENGFNDLHCVSNGRRIADWGDTAVMSGALTRDECYAASGGRNNVFVWADMASSGLNYASLIENAGNPSENSCWIRVDIASDDKKIPTSGMKSKYFKSGDNVVCGSWLDAKSVEKIVLDAKKGKRTLGAVAGAVGGAAVGVGVMELFGNKLIGGAVEGQKSLTDEELIHSNMTDDQRASYEMLREDLRRKCAELRNAGGNSKNCN